MFQPSPSVSAKAVHQFWGAWALVCCLLATAGAQALEQSPVNGGALGWNPEQQGRFLLRLASDERGRIWVGTEDNGVSCYDPAAPDGNRWKQYTTKDGLGDDTAYALAIDGRGRVWVGHLNHGVSVFNGKAWRNYDVLQGPLGERVFDIATNPVDGDIWIATDAGLARYSMKQNTWRYYTRDEGLPSDQIAALAIDASGTIYAGTQCDGLATADSKDDYTAWRLVPAPDRMPLQPVGEGLPGDLINDIMIARNGSVYVATSNGLALSRDRGRTWYYLRGEDWRDKVRGLYPQAAAKDAPVQGDLLAEDWVTALAEDAAGMLWIGYRRSGYEMRDPASNQRMFGSAENAPGAAVDDYVRAILPLPRASGTVAPFVAHYGQEWGGLATAVKTLGSNTGQPQALPAPPANGTTPFPFEAKPPTAEALAAMLQRVQALDKPLQPGQGVFLRDDWSTRGDWGGRYGRLRAILCGSMGFTSQELGWSGEHRAEFRAGANRLVEGRGVFGYVSEARTDDPRALYNPLSGHRRMSELNDGSFNRQVYTATHDGPDLWVTVTVPDGVHRVSLYFANKDGHTTTARFRDYTIELKPFVEDIKDAETAPTMASARVHNFWGGVYKSFAICGPGKFNFKIKRNYSHVTQIQGVFIDKLAGTKSRYDTMPPAWFGDLQLLPPTPEAPAEGDSPALRVARTLWSALDDAQAMEGAAAVQRPLRLQAYRAAIAEGAPPLLLANWRWHLSLWLPEDRKTFNDQMAQAWAAQVKISPNLAKQD